MGAVPAIGGCLGTRQIHGGSPAFVAAEAHEHGGSPRIYAGEERFSAPKTRRI